MTTAEILVLVGQAVTIATIIYKDRARRLALHDATKAQADKFEASTKAAADILAAAANAQATAIATAAQLVDTRVERDRQYQLEDRRLLAADLAAKVQQTADTLAAKVRDDAAHVAQIQREHAQQIADTARHEQIALGSKVESATTLATQFVDELKEKIDVVGGDAKAAYHEANGAKLLLAEEVRRRNDLQTAADARNHVSGAPVSDDPPKKDR